MTLGAELRDRPLHLTGYVLQIDLEEPAIHVWFAGKIVTLTAEELSDGRYWVFA